MKNLKPYLLPVIALTAFINLEASAQGDGGHVGGGDACERKIKAIRNALKDWIRSGGGKQLTFNYGITYDVYREAMLEILAPARVAISCVRETPENNYAPIKVGGVPKTCANYPIDKAHPQKRVICDFDRLMSLEVSTERTKLEDIHHEYASLTDPRIERSKPNGDSDYFVSNQVAARFDEIMEAAGSTVSNKSAPNGLTGKKPKGEFHTTLAGLEAVGGGLAIRWGVVLKDAQVKKLEFQLKHAKADLSSATQNLTHAQQLQTKASLTEDYLAAKGRIDHLEKQFERGTMWASEISRANALAEKINSGAYISEADKFARIDRATGVLQKAKVAYQKALVKLTDARRTVLERMSVGKKVIRGVRVVAGTYLVIDAISRTYLWYATDEMPGLIATADLIRWMKSYE